MEKIINFINKRKDLTYHIFGRDCETLYVFRILNPEKMFKKRFELYKPEELEFSWSISRRQSVYRVCGPMVPCGCSCTESVDAIFEVIEAWLRVVERDRLFEHDMALLSRVEARLHEIELELKQERM